MPDSAQAASLVSICAARPGTVSDHVASSCSWPSRRRRCPCLTGVRPAGGRDDRGATRSAAEEYSRSRSNTDFQGNVLDSAATGFNYFGGMARHRLAAP